MESLRSFVVLGAGWLGLPFCKAAHNAGWSVAFTQTEETAAFFQHNARWRALVYQLGQPFPDSLLEGANRLVITLPPSLKGKTANPLDSVEELAEGLGAKVSCPVLMLSSTGIYEGLSGNLSEEDAPGPTTRAQHLFELEKTWAGHIRNLTIFRLGGLIGPGRHPGIWAGKKSEIDRPQDSLQLLHQLDAVRAVMAWTHEPFPGIYNVVSDYRPTRLEFYRLWNPQIKPSVLQQLSPKDGFRRVCLNQAIKKAAHINFEVNGPEDFMRTSF